jgi:hypothetical protein
MAGSDCREDVEPMEVASQLAIEDVTEASGEDVNAWKVSALDMIGAGCM